MRRLLSLSIRNLMIILIVIITVVPLGIILFSAYNQHRQEIRDARLLLERLADDICDNQSLQLSGAEQLLRTLSHLPAVQKRDAKAVSALLAELVNKNPQYSNLFITDKTGMRWAIAIPSDKIQAVADRRYFKNALASGHFSSGEYGVGRALKKPVLNFAYPIKAASGKITDVAVVVFALENYAQRFKSLNIPANTSLLLTDHKGTILFNVTAPQTIGQQDRDDLFIQMAVGPDKGLFEAVSNIGIRRYFAYQKLRLSGEQTPYMYVRVGIPVETVLAKTNSKLVLNLGVMLSLLLLSVGFAVYFTKKGVIDKIMTLRDAAQKVARGDLDVRVTDFVSGGELGELGRAFDEMTIALINKNEERRRHEKELSQYADIVARMQVGLYVYRLEDPSDDHSLKLVAANPTAVNKLGVTEQEIIGKGIDDIFPGLRQKGIPQKFADVARTGLSFEMEEFSYSDVTVKEATFAFKVFSLPDNCVGVLFEDITERKNAEAALHKFNEELEGRVQQRTAELNALNSELEAFSYSVSHDMRAPLHRITGFADIMLEECAAKLSAKELHYVSRIKAASQIMNEQIEGLLKLYQISHGELYKESVNMSATALELLHGLHDLEPDRQVSFTVADGMVVNADKSLLKLLLGNFISNAWKFTSNKDEAIIAVGITEQDGRNVYFVRDNGIGFDSKYIDNIFTPFQRLHQDDTGVGIGLAAAQRIIRLHGGKLWAEGKEGAGATFYFTV